MGGAKNEEGSCDKLGKNIENIFWKELRIKQEGTNGRNCEEIINIQE